MRNITAIGNDIIENDHILDKEEAERLDNAVVNAFQPVANARGLLPVDTGFGAGTQYVKVKRRNFDEKAEDGFVAKAAEYPAVTVTEDEVMVKVEKMGRSFHLTREDILSARNGVEPLDASGADAAGRATGQTESHLIMQGSPEVPGLFDSSNTEINVTDWEANNTAGSAVQDDLQSMKNELPDEAMEGREITLVTTRSQVQYFNTMDSTVDRKIRDFVDAEVDNVEWNSFVPAGKALIKVEGQDIADYKLVEELTTVANNEGEETSNDTFEWKTRLRSVPIVKKRDGFVQGNLQ